MAIAITSSTPFDDQKPGTSGLRRRVSVFKQPHYIQNYLASIFTAIDASGKTLVMGGDGRYFSDYALEQALRMASVYGVARVIVGANGLLSTPAVSHLIRITPAFGAIIFTASHNPGGVDGDFGIKYNTASGAPADEILTDLFFHESLRLSSYRLWDGDFSVSLDTIGSYRLGGMQVDVIDPVDSYASMLSTLFDFPRIRSFLADKSFIFDGMHGVIGVYARRIFHDALGVPLSSLYRCNSLPDFGGLHPDPNPTTAHDLLSLMLSPDAPFFGAACDADGDRYMILGAGMYVSPADSLAVLADNISLVEAYGGKLSGVARSIATSSAVDRVAAQQGVPCFIVPTGWKYFTSLLDSGSITLCGEESFGAGSSHIREKDALWAIVFWLHILSYRKTSVAALLQQHWQTYGRTFSTRHDYENLPIDVARKLMSDFYVLALSCKGSSLPTGLSVLDVEDFSYTDPTTGHISSHQGIVVDFSSDYRLVLRLSGTGTVGATLRFYGEWYTDDPSFYGVSGYGDDVQTILHSLMESAVFLSKMEKIGRMHPDVII